MAAQLTFAGFAWKNLWRRRLRTLLTLGGIGMGIGAFVGLVGFMAMSVFERTREIGILRALGWGRGRVILLIQSEAAALGLAGGVFGLGAGWAALRVLAHLPRTETIVSDSFTWTLPLEALAIAVLAGLLAGALPAWRAAQLAPVEALRHD